MGFRLSSRLGHTRKFYEKFDRVKSGTDCNVESGLVVIGSRPNDLI